MADPPATHAETRLGLNPGAYPYESRFAQIGQARLHYIDEGRGPLVLMLHGNPTWSILYRGLIDGLRDSYRCVAVDLAGFGLSQAPPGFSFLPEDHALLITALLEQLDLREATLVAHD